MPSNGIAGSNGISISRSLRNRHTVFHNSCTNLHSHQQCKGVPISPHLLQHLWSPDFLMTAILTVVRWYLNVVLIFISLMNSDDEHFFICLLASYMSSFESVCSYPLPTFEWVCLWFSYKSVLILYGFWILALCQMGRLQKFFYHSVGYQFTLMIVSFAVQKLWSLIRFHLSILDFVAIAFGFFCHEVLA